LLISILNDEGCDIPSEPLAQLKPHIIPDAGNKEKNKIGAGGGKLAGLGETILPSRQKPVVCAIWRRKD